MGTMAEVGLATNFEWCSVATQPLKAHSFVQATLYIAFGFGEGGRLCL